MCSRVYLHLNTRSEPGKLVTPYDLPCACAMDPVTFSEKKCGPSRMLAWVGGMGVEMEGHIQE